MNKQPIAVVTGASRGLNEKELFELAALIGQFTTVAYSQNALRLRLSDGNDGLRARVFLISDIRRAANTY